MNKDYAKIDYTKFKEIADTLIPIYTNDWKIPNNSYISDELMDLLFSYNEIGIDVSFLFEAQGHVGAHSYLSNVVCCQCNRVVDKVFTKAELIGYVTSESKTVLCDNCQNEINEQRKFEDELKRKRDKLQLSRKKLDNTLHYIDNYLNPNMSWSKDIKTYDRYTSIKTGFVNWDMICDHIKSMNYKDFLNTPYWKAIANVKKHQVGYKCQMCGSNHKLVVHHRNYDNHGKEHTFDVMKSDLIVLCNKCHKKFHNIEEDE